MMHELLFPELKGKKWTCVDLNKISTEEKFNIVNPVAQEKWLASLHTSLGTDYTYGGYMEHREKMLSGHYHSLMDNDHFWHLGIDYNVPADTPVHLPFDGELFHTQMDKDYYGGWGGKLIFKIKDLYVIFGHLDNIVEEYKSYKKGEVIAKVGNFPVNGNWFAHLHLQCCKNFNPTVDGYSHYYKGIEKDFPDPNKLIKKSRKKVLK